MLSHDSCSSTPTETGDLALYDSCLAYLCAAKRRRQLWDYRYENQIYLTKSRLKTESANYDTGKTQLLFNLSMVHAPALRLIQLWGHQSNKASTGSIHSASQTD